MDKLDRSNIKISMYIIVSLILISGLCINSYKFYDYKQKAPKTNCWEETHIEKIGIGKGYDFDYISINGFVIDYFYINVDEYTNESDNICYYKNIDDSYICDPDLDIISYWDTYISGTEIVSTLGKLLKYCGNENKVCLKELTETKCEVLPGADPRNKK